MILIVEDNPEVAALFVEALTAAGHRAEIAATGAAAVARLADHGAPVRLILLDLSLPDVNGADLLAALRRQGVVTPAIAVSGAIPLVDPALLLAAGFAAMLEKPVRLSALLKLVGEHMAEST
ncbi:MAG: response regulator [Rhodospirillaceae bacterium]